MHPDDCILDKILELRLPALQGLLGFLAFADLCLQRPGLLLQENNAAQTVVFADQVRVALGGNDLGMFRTNLSYRLPVRLLGKKVQRVGAMQMKGMGAAELVPELLQANGGVRLSLGPQQRDHFSEGGDPKMFAGNRPSTLRDAIPDLAPKAPR